MIPILFVLFTLIYQNVNAQPSVLPFDSLDRNALQLSEINLRYGNTYRFNTLITSDSVLYMLPSGLPKGYYEAYYQNDSNRLALTYYNFGNKSYSQQFYGDGSMKADSEYDRYGNMHGLHVVYAKNGDEIWHADYWHGSIEPKYEKKYLEYFNYTNELIANKKAFGCYEFSPTPMRERHDQIELRPDGTFSFHNFKADCDCRRHSEGKWQLKDSMLYLEADKKDVWPMGAKRSFVLISKRGRNPVLIEYNDYGLNWYASEFYLCKKCNCIRQ